MNTHTCYLTRYNSRDAIVWSVIVNALPICADKVTRAEAEAAAVQMNVKPTAIWDGGTGKFYPLDTFA